MAKEEKVALVIGSAHLDVLSRTTGDEAVIDKIGLASLEIGGTACNIACNLAVLGIKTRLLTSMNIDSPYSFIISEYLRSHGVDLQVVHDKDLPAAVYSAHIGLDGELISSVSSVPVSMAEFPCESVKAALRGAACVILECNLSASTLASLAKIANEQGVPVFVAAVSEEKSLRIGEITTPIAAVFMNQRETAYFGRMTGSASLRDIARQLGCVLVSTQGADGVNVVDGGKETHIPAVLLTNSSVVQTLGAGDALLASTIVGHVFKELSLRKAVRSATRFATKIISRPHCNAGQGKGVEIALMSLDNKAHKDGMTGLLNRSAMTAELTSWTKRHLAGQSDLSVLMLDIDKFKLVNDTYGHDEGDLVIKSVADVIRNSLRDGDIAGRWGGEEFICLLPCDRETALAVAERIRSRIESTPVGKPGRVTASIGLAAASTHASWEDLVKSADLALYDAKHGGRNRVAFRVDEEKNQAECFA